MTYYMIFTRDSAAASWAPQFGDSDRECVMQERADTYVRQRGLGYDGDCKFKASDVRVERFSREPSNDVVVERTLTLNAKA